MIIFLLLIRCRTLSSANWFLLHLCFALMATLIIVLLAVEPSKADTKCTAAAVLLHYFLLSAFLWMLMEGLLLYTNIVRMAIGEAALTAAKACWIAWGKLILLYAGHELVPNFH